MTTPPSSGIENSGFHDSECAAYRADLALWLALAETTGGPIIDLGSGTGRTSLPLAEAGHEVIAVDLEPDLLDELGRRAADQGLAVRTAPGDLRTLGIDLPGDLPPAALVLIPMQTIQLVGGPAERVAAFKGAASLARPGAEMAVAIVPEIEPFDARDQFPPLLPPDVAFLGGYRFESTPLAVLQDTPADRIDMHRRRVVRDETGMILGTPQEVVITLDPVTVPALQAEGAAGGWTPTEVVDQPATDEHAAGVVVMFRLDGDPA